jgi:L-lysine exporter family protein LysE/ArgO
MFTASALAAPLLQGFGLGAGLIIAIGAQNAFVLRQGLERRHVFATAAICTLCDMTLIALGVGGMGSLVTRLPALSAAASWGGAAFLLAGSVGARFPPDQRVGFAAGAMLASTVWFFGLAYGAAQLAPLFRRPAAWRVLDVVIGVTMWAIAISLIRDAVR